LLLVTNTTTSKSPLSFLVELSWWTLPRKRELRLDEETGRTDVVIG
jgi:hypothetical protein